MLRIRWLAGGNGGDDTLIGGDGSDVWWSAVRMMVEGGTGHRCRCRRGGGGDGGGEGSYEFGVDALSGSLTVTSKDTGSVDIVEGQNGDVIFANAGDDLHRVRWFR